MPFNKTGVGHGFDRNGLLNESIEQLTSAGGRTPIKPEGEFIEIMVKMLPGSAPLVDAQEPALEQRGNAMRVRKDVGSGPRLMSVSMWLEYAYIGWIAIGDDGRARGHALFGELDQAIPSGDVYPLEADASCARLALLDGDKDDSLVPNGPSSRTTFAASPNKGFVHFDCSHQGLAIGSYHGPAQLVQACPSRAIAADSQSSLHTQRTDTTLLVGEPPDRSKPKAQRKMTVLEDRPGGCRSHGTTILALPKLPSELPTPVQSALWAPKTIRPSNADQIAPAVLFCPELAFKFQKVSGKQTGHESSLYVIAT